MPGPEEASTSTLYVINGRYLNAKTHAPLTLRYVGVLPDTQLTWLGVEYDDPAKGKHSGDYKGSSVFRTTQSGAGAFIKFPPEATPLLRGVTLVSALQDRYGALDTTEGRAAPVDEAEAVTLGSSNGILVEAPGMADVRKRIGRLERLREIGFDGEWVGQLGGSDHERKLFKERLGGVRTLDLSRNLLPSWKEVWEIVEHLLGLNTLVLNHSRFAKAEQLSMSDRESACQAFRHVTELHLGDCALSWSEAVQVARLFPALEALYLNDNPINELDSGADIDAATALPRLKLLSLDRCGITQWTHVASGLLPLSALDTLHLSDNPITSIPAPSGASFQKLTTLALRNTYISAWIDIDHLASWAKLENLRISCVNTTNAEGEPQPKQTEDPFIMTGDAHADRSIIIAKFASLTSLNGTAVTKAERWDAELHYITFANRHRGEWGRYDELVRLHGPAQKEKPKSSNLQSKMININVIPPSGYTFTLRLLRSAPVSMLHKRVSKHLNTDAKTWTARPHPEAPEALGAWEPVEEMDSGELDKWVSDGDTVVAVIE